MNIGCAVSTKQYRSAIARYYLSLNSECAKAYCDGCFSVSSRGRSHRHREVSESVNIHVQRPAFPPFSVTGI